MVTTDDQEVAAAVVPTDAHGYGTAGIDLLADFVEADWTEDGLGAQPAEPVERRVEAVNAVALLSRIAAGEVKLSRSDFTFSQIRGRVVVVLDADRHRGPAPLAHDLRAHVEVF